MRSKHATNTSALCDYSIHNLTFYLIKRNIKFVQRENITEIRTGFGIVYISPFLRDAKLTPFSISSKKLKTAGPTFSSLLSFKWTSNAVQSSLDCYIRFILRPTDMQNLLRVFYRIPLSVIWFNQDKCQSF